MSGEKIVNGVDVDKYFNTIEHIKEEPEIAKLFFCGPLCEALHK